MGRSNNLSTHCIRSHFRKLKLGESNLGKKRRKKKKKKKKERKKPHRAARAKVKFN